MHHGFPSGECLARRNSPQQQCCPGTGRLQRHHLQLPSELKTCHPVPTATGQCGKVRGRRREDGAPIGLPGREPSRTGLALGLALSSRCAGRGVRFHVTVVRLRLEVLVVVALVQARAGAPAACAATGGRNLMSTLRARTQGAGRAVAFCCFRPAFVPPHHGRGAKGSRWQRAARRCRSRR